MVQTRMVMAWLALVGTAAGVALVAVVALSGPSAPMRAEYGCAEYPERCVTVTPLPTVDSTPLPRLTATPGTPFVPGPCLTPGRCP